MKFFFIIITISILSIRQSLAQATLTPNFRFNNGLYTSFEECQKNQPSISWDAVTSKLIVIESLDKAKMEHLQMKSTKKDIDLSKIWGFSVNGTPYIRVAEQTDSFALFAALQVRGNISYFEYRSIKKEPVVISAYNPNTGEPFLSDTIIKEKEVIYKKMLRWKTGKIQDFTLQNVEKWIASDKKLLATYLETPVQKRLRQLLKFVLIFNDRNIIKI